MRQLILVCVFLAIACRDRRPAVRQTVTDQQTAAAPVTRDSLAPPKGRQEIGTPKTASTSAGAYDDSVIATGHGTEVIVTASGDTIQWLGGTLFNVDQTGEYGAEEYRKNAVKYLRITLQTGNTPDGRPILITKARAQLPPMTSSEELILEGLCRVNEVRDPLIVAIATIPDGETYGPANYAVRYDPKLETLTQISPTNVTCAHVVGEN